MGKSRDVEPLAKTENLVPDNGDWLAAIIDGSDDAIISKDLSGKIRSWNASATRLFGYTAEEMIGQSITLLIPSDRQSEEPNILSQIRIGQRVDHFETIRMRKDGTLVELSLTISPIRNNSGVIVGASKIARDFTERRQSEERQRLLLGEMRHRVKNLFALASAIVSFSGRSVPDAAGLTASIRARLSALARAHELTMSSWEAADPTQERTDLLSLIETIVEPYREHDCVTISGDTVSIGVKAAANIALLLHELATNAAKYGALSSENGKLRILVEKDATALRINWSEDGGPAPEDIGPAGFGSRLEAGLLDSWGATIERDWRATGLIATLSLPNAALEH